MRIFNKIYSLAVFMMACTCLMSCTEGNDWNIDDAFSRLFGVDGENFTIEAEDTRATVKFTGVPDAEYYIIEVSKDSLYDDVEMGGPNAIVYGEDKSIVKSPAVLENLAGDTKYFLRIKSMSDAENESHWAYYREGQKVKTFKTKAEQIFLEPEASDRSENSLRVKWTPGAAVTNLLVANGDGEEIMNIELDDAVKAASEYTITGLTPSTSYIITIMNGDAKRGVLNMSTTAAMPEGDYKTELAAGITRITDDVISDIVDAAKAATGKENVAVTIGLQPDRRYDVASYAEDGTDAGLRLPEGASVTFFGMAGGEAPTLNMIKSLNIEGGHTYIRFENVNFTDGGCQYFINQSTSSTIAELSFKQCRFTDFERSLIRTQGSGVINIDNVIVDNCVLTNMSHGNGYSVLYFGTATTHVGRLELVNSTIDTTQRSVIEASKAPIANGVYITNCTFYNNVAAGRYFMDANGQSTNLTMTNTILGKTMDATSRGARTAGTMEFNNCIRTSDCVYGSNDIKDLPVDTWSSADIFKAPDSHDFTLKISKKVGDPRWYPAE